MRRFLVAHTASSAMAATSVAPIESAFTKVPTEGSPMASERMMPVHSPRVPRASAGRQMVDTTWR